MLNILILAAALDMPPMPPGYTPKTATLSPKATELKASLGTPMAKVAVSGPLAAPTGFVITNITVQNGTVSLSWQLGQPLFQVLGTTLSGSWINVGGLTTSHQRTFSELPQHFFRISQSNSLPLNLNPTNQPRLTWTTPELDMSDSLTTYTLQKTQTQPSTTQPISDDTGWSLVSNPAANATSATDSTIPPVWYRLKQTTANGVVVPFTIPSLSGAQSGVPVLERLYGGTALGAGCTTKACVVDHAGNLIVVGQMLYGNNFGNGLTITSQGGQDMFVAKWRPDGVCLWSLRLGNVSNDSFNGVAVDSLNNIYAIGSVSGGIDPGILDFGAGAIQSYGGSDICLVKIRLDGTVNWMKLFGGSGADVGNGIAIDSNDNLFITGTYGFFGSAPDFGGGQLPASSNVQFTFLVKLDSNGNHIWSKGFGGTNDSNQGNAVAVGPDGNPVLAATFRSSNANFGGALVSSAGAYDGLLAKYSGVNGSQLWQKQFGDPSDQKCKAVAVGPNNEVYAGGEFTGTVVFGTDTVPAAAGGSIFLVKYDANGVYQWVGAWGAEINPPNLASVVLDGSGRPYIGGQIVTAIDFGTGWLLGSANDSLLVAVNSGAPTVRWALRCGPDYGGSSVAGASYNSIANQMVFASDCGSNGIRWGNPDNALKLTTSGTLNNSWWATFRP